MTPATRLRTVRALVYRCPLETPVMTSFGVMRDRPMVLVRVEDDDGLVGWGEVWCNYPSVGAEHRARLVTHLFAPLLEGQAFDSPAHTQAELTRRTAILALQSGEQGPFSQCIAGIDIALWDLAAKRARQPLWRLLNGSSGRIRTYASGLNPQAPEKLATKKFSEGFRAFKLKVGFGLDRDVVNLKALRTALGPDATLMADANQAWTLREARHAARLFEPIRLRWLEEPLPANRPIGEWRALSQATDIPLAAGENLAGKVAFRSAIRSGALAVVQPDVAKWGGISMCLSVAEAARAADLLLCPHYLGGGVGLLASGHFLAAAGGDGMLEVDANPNPLRSALCGPLNAIDGGCCDLGESSGLGLDRDPDQIGALEPFLRSHH